MNNEKLLAKILEKWPVKVLSLAAALIIAVFYRMNTLETRSFSVPLKIETNGFLLPTGSYVNTVRINLRGEANGIFPILEEDIEAFIDLNKYAGEGLYRIPVQIRKKGSALGVEPLEISVVPTEIPITIEQKVTRNIPVFPVLSGTIAQGYELTAQTIIPDRVTAEGPRSVLENQYNFLTGTIDLEERHENFAVLINIINDNPFVSIHGSRVVEYHGTISRITRSSETVFSVPDSGEAGQ